MPASIEKHVTPGAEWLTPCKKGTGRRLEMTNRSDAAVLTRDNRLLVIPECVDIAVPCSSPIVEGVVSI